MAECRDIVSDPFTVTLIKIKANQLCRRADFSRSDYDDLRQDMRMYLLEKAHLFDPQRGNLEAFVISVLKTWAAMRLRHRKRQKRHEGNNSVSLEGTAVECEGENIPLGATMLEEDGQRRTQAYPISEIEHMELREAIDHAMQGISPEDQAFLMQVAEQGARATARSMGVSWKSVHNRVARLRGHFEKAGLASD